eukprot:1364717-Rhodomonas_salina.1
MTRAEAGAAMASTTTSLIADLTRPARIALASRWSQTMRMEDGPTRRAGEARNRTRKREQSVHATSGCVLVGCGAHPMFSKTCDRLCCSFSSLDWALSGISVIVTSDTTSNATGTPTKPEGKYWRCYHRSICVGHSCVSALASTACRAPRRLSTGRSMQVSTEHTHIA